MLFATECACWLHTVLCNRINLQLKKQHGPVAAAVCDKLTRTAYWLGCMQFGVFWTNGQICSSTSRLLVQEGIVPAFYKQLKQRAESIKLCNPMVQDCRMGPVVNQSQHEKILDFIEVS